MGCCRSISQKTSDGPNLRGRKSRVLLHSVRWCGSKDASTAIVCSGVECVLASFSFYYCPASYWHRRITASSVDVLAPRYRLSVDAAGVYRLWGSDGFDINTAIATSTRIGAMSLEFSLYIDQRALCASIFYRASQTVTVLGSTSSVACVGSELTLLILPVSSLCYREPYPTALSFMRRCSLAMASIQSASLLPFGVSRYLPPNPFRFRFWLRLAFVYHFLCPSFSIPRLSSLQVTFFVQWQKWQRDTDRIPSCRTRARIDLWGGGGGGGGWGNLVGRAREKRQKELGICARPWNKPLLAPLPRSLKPPPVLNLLGEMLLWSPFSTSPHAEYFPNGTPANGSHPTGTSKSQGSPLRAGL